MDETKRAWDEVGEGFVKLGRIISARYRTLGEERAEQAPDAAEESGVGDSIRRATEELDRAFTSLGDTLRDEEARQHVRDTGRRLSDALKVTISEVGEEVRRAVGGRSQESGEPPAPEHPDDSGSSA
jgi:hypothetical protein